MHVSPYTLVHVDLYADSDTLTARHDRFKQRMRELKERQKYADNWWHALRAAVDAHPDRQAILADSQRRAGR
ncbi:hypothetical protein ACFU6I_43595 [Streptomyces sp. NPDC057486]|uniref:hypothetical protein n=1 Tax=Streptomyces sp. NPDC057486 TaxID=3346145 RepID=UPI00367DB8CF